MTEHRTFTVNANGRKFTYTVASDGKVTMTDGDKAEMVRYFEDKGYFVDVDVNAGALTLVPRDWWDSTDDTQP